MTKSLLAYTACGNSLAYIRTAPGARKNPHDADIENYGWNDAP